MHIHDIMCDQFLCSCSIVVSVPVQLLEILTRVSPETITKCPGEPVVFRCETRKSSILRWTSDVLIGSNGEQLTFITAFRNGHTLTVGSAIAFLKSKECQNGSCTLVSLITVYVPEDTVPSILSCHSDNQTVNVTINPKSKYT